MDSNHKYLQQVRLINQTILDLKIELGRTLLRRTKAVNKKDFDLNTEAISHYKMLIFRYEKKLSQIE